MLKDLKQKAHDLGLTSDQVRAFGDLRYRTTWEAAINATSPKAAQRTSQITALQLQGLDEAIASEVCRSPLPPAPCPRCHGAKWEIAPASPFAPSASLFTPCPACQGTGSAIPQAARDPPVGPA